MWRDGLQVLKSLLVQLATSVDWDRYMNDHLMSATPPRSRPFSFPSILKVMRVFLGLVVIVLVILVLAVACYVGFLWLSKWSKELMDDDHGTREHRSRRDGARVAGRFRNSPRFYSSDEGSNSCSYSDHSDDYSDSTSEQSSEGSNEEEWQETSRSHRPSRRKSSSLAKSSVEGRDEKGPEPEDTDRKKRTSRHLCSTSRHHRCSHGRLPRKKKPSRQDLAQKGNQPDPKASTSAAEDTNGINSLASVSASTSVEAQ